MKKYKICDKLSEVVIGLGVLVMLFSMCIDVDVEPNQGFLPIIIGMAIGFGLIGLGFALSYASTIDGVIFSLVLIALAGTYSIFKSGFECMEMCYRMKRKKGYKGLFRAGFDYYEKLADEGIRE